jgi:hypothetical protein
MELSRNTYLGKVKGKRLKDRDNGWRVRRWEGEREGDTSS